MILTPDQMREELVRVIRKQGSVYKWCKRVGYKNQSYVADVMKDRRPVSATLAAALGYRRVSVVGFEPVEYYGTSSP